MAAFFILKDGVRKMGKTAVIFPGQGAQYVGMAKDFYDSFEDSKAVFDEAAGVLDVDLLKLCFEENDDINKTEFTQPAMVAAEAAIYEHLKNMGLEADVFAGLSLGEYAALYACGAMRLTDAIKTVRQRGILMQNTVPLGQGAMAAVIAMDADKIAQICEETPGNVQIANYNCPGQIVISGENAAIDAAIEALKEAGAKRVIKLNVSGPFHSKMLVPAGEELFDIDVSVAAENGSMVIRVRDFGPDIPVEELPYVKQKFYKGSSKARGSGIGLAVCDEIMRLHNGTFDIANASGGGAVVTMTLPMEK